MAIPRSTAEELARVLDLGLYQLPDATCEMLRWAVNAAEGRPIRFQLLSDEELAGLRQTVDDVRSRDLDAFLDGILRDDR